jgi:hypothetical protein
MGLSQEVLKGNLSEVLDQIANAFRPPANDETSLELADKLIFSPGPGTTWEFPEQTKSGIRRLFSIRIGRTSDPRLRAIWSRRLSSGIIPANTSELTKRDWGIVAQTSVGGLPALRRGVDDEKLPSIKSALAKVPRGNVVRPDPPPKYIQDVDTLLAGHQSQPSDAPAPPESGIALTTTFDYADVELTAFGATARMEWKGTPPIYEPTTALRFRPKAGSDPVAIAGTALERLFFSEFLGQDETIIEAYKGFLLPIGFRATFLKTQKRGYVPDPRRPGSLVAANIYTVRIVTRRPVKAFPALNQPDGGRDWPASSATLLTEATPVLIDPADAHDDLRQLTDKYSIPSSSIFWPRIRRNGTEVAHFEWKVQIESDVTPMTARMIFLDNSVVGVDNIVAEAVAIYNRDALAVNATSPNWPDSNTARLYGTRRRYANTSEKADTSFDTDSWLLTARGRLLGGKQSFIMDARMNGADQPPFFPSVRRTKISVQSVDRLVGAPQGLIECMPDTDFVGKGFSGLANDPEIFLDVISPKIAFSLIGANQATVGVAQPKSFVAALSRLSGVVGGAERPSISKSLVRAMGDGSDDLAFDFGNARLNKFDKKEAFNGAFVILGVNLIDLISSAAEDTLDQGPKLIEQFFYGVDSAGEKGLEQVKAIAHAAADAADAAFNNGGHCGPSTTTVCGSMDEAIEKLDHNLSPYKLSFAILYPDFYASYVRAKSDVLSALRGVGTAPDLASLSTEASRALVATKPFISAVETLVENPVPQAFENVIGQVQTWWQGLEDALRGGLTAFLDTVTQNVFLNILVPVLASATSEELELWFGAAVAPTDLIKLLLDPSARADLAQAFAYEQVGKPLVQIAAVLGDLSQGLRGQILLGRRSLERQFEGFVQEAELVIASRLDPNSTNGIADPSRQSAMTDELLLTTEASLASFHPPNPSSADSLRKYLSELPNRFQNSIPTHLRGTLAAHPTWFVAIHGDSDAAVLETFVDHAIDKVTTAAVQAVKEAADSALAMVNKFAAEADRQVQLLSEALVGILASELDVVTNSRVAEAASGLGDWCAGSGGALMAAIAFGDALLTDSQTTTQRIANLINVTAGIAAPAAPPEATAAFNEARKALLSAADVLVAANTKLTSARSGLRAIAAGNACALAATLVQSVDVAIGARNIALSALLEIARAYQKLTAVPPAQLTPGAATVADVGNLIRQLICDITTIGKAGTSKDWTRLSSAIARLKVELGPFKQFVTTLGNSLKKVEDSAKDFRDKIAIADPTALVQLASQIAGEYVANDRNLAAVALQTIIFSATTLRRIEDASLPMIKGVAGAVADFEASVATNAAAVYQGISQNEILSYLINLASSADLSASIQALKTEVSDLQAVTSATTSDDAITRVDPLIRKWRAGQIPLTALFDQFVHIVDVLFQGNIAQLFGADIRLKADAIKGELSEAIKQFVPTRIETGYDWTTQLGSSSFFAIDPGTSEDVNDTHLTLSSRVSYDFISNSSTAEMHGRLHSFAIMLPEMAIIHFGPAVFSGGTGRATSFDVKVLSVEIGSYLKFLEQLSAWMSPSGNGVYVVPAVDSIRVGYQFASDLIAVGDLEFMNIAIDVFAALPFGPGAARFGFNFASENRPFIIACAPYGGGGYVQMEMEAGGSIQNLAISFVFGAAVAIDFGFLSGYGRISAGFALIKHKDGLTIQAIVEAVGEGHIACFSLSIFIRIVLQHSAQGDMDGFATYSFSFKVGFFSVDYSVTAHRHISGPSKGSNNSQLQFRAERLVGASLDEPTFTIDTSAPVRSRAWAKYRRHIALDLIDDHW